MVENKTEDFTPRPGVSTISNWLYGELKREYWGQLERAALYPIGKKGINYQIFTFYFFVKSVNIWEAILSELFREKGSSNSAVPYVRFSDVLKSIPGKKLENLEPLLKNEKFREEFAKVVECTVFDHRFEIVNVDEAIIERWSISQKTKELIRRRLGQGLDLSKREWEDFRQMMVIRDEIIHYKYMQSRDNKKLQFDEALKFFERKNLTWIDYASPDFKQQYGSWTDNLSTTECMRFCINTVTKLCLMLKELIVDSGNNHYINQLNRFQHFKEITREEVTKFLEKNGIDPKSNFDLRESIRRGAEKVEDHE